MNDKQIVNLYRTHVNKLKVNLERNASVGDLQTLFSDFQKAIQDVGSNSLQVRWVKMIIQEIIKQKI